MAIDINNTISLETYQISNEDLKGYFLANSALFAGGFENKINRTRQEIENLTKMIMELNYEAGKEALKNGEITKSDYTKNVIDISKKDFLIAALKGHFLGIATLGVYGWKRGEELKRLQKELQEKLKEFDDAVTKAISTENYEDTISNPDKDERLNAIEEIEALTEAKSEEIEELSSQIDECVQVDAVLGKIEKIAQEALDKDQVDVRVGEITHIALTELFGRVGITDEVTLPSLESFTKSSTSPYAMGIAVDAIQEARKTISVSVETALALIEHKANEVQVANESMKDDIKDFLSRKSGKKQLDRIETLSTLVKEASTRRLNKDMKEESGIKVYFSSPKALGYLGKRYVIVDDISKGIYEDAQVIEKLTSFLKTVNGELTKESPNKDKIVSAASTISDVAMQGNVFINVGKNAKTKAYVSDIQPITEDYSVLGMTLSVGIPTIIGIATAFKLLGLPLLAVPMAASALTGSLIGGTVGKKLFSDPKLKKNLIKIEDSLFKGQDNFKQVATKYAQSLDAFHKVASDFQKIVEEKKKSEDPVTRETIRIGHAIINAMDRVAFVAIPFYRKVA